MLASFVEKYGKDRAAGGMHKCCPLMTSKNVVFPALDGPRTAQCCCFVFSTALEGRDHVSPGNIAGFEAAS